ncbi:hypothetical protein VDGL01_08815 [Verticillium dahliae]
MLSLVPIWLVTLTVTTAFMSIATGLVSNAVDLMYPARAQGVNGASEPQRHWVARCIIARDSGNSLTLPAIILTACFLHLPKMNARDP